MHRPVFAPYGEFFCLFLWDFFFFFRNSTLIIFRKVKLRVLSQWDILNLPCYWKNLKVAACFFCLLRNLATTGEVFENAANSLTRVTTCAKFEEGKLGIKWFWNLFFWTQDSFFVLKIFGELNGEGLEIKKLYKWYLEEFFGSFFVCDFVYGYLEIY